MPITLDSYSHIGICCGITQTWDHHLNESYTNHADTLDLYGYYTGIPLVFLDAEIASSIYIKEEYVYVTN